MSDHRLMLRHKMPRIDLPVPCVTFIDSMLTRWLIADGGWVEVDDILCEYDFSSHVCGGLVESTLEFHSMGRGILHQTTPAGAMVRAGENVGWIETPEG